VTYTNESKVAELGVQPATLAVHGAVSEPVAQEMAVGARERAKTDYAIAITGIAGPDGGTEAKPVGTVCFALAYEGGCDVRTFAMFGDRDMVRDRSTKMAMTMLRFKILGHPLPF
jgi:nicotinamide-nucleotide amidase